ncbi:hypothetical protein LX15_006199 [Streptoalloteichus tenebrarius]|uniref:WXG100 family type VII secretion target n=1 Tax=Streptoalloteichus tenebrarius (strain ATCC 17920 / DSM 40477 / JCM 4838 / CBS 697.72 / NBRC 16177 / NCIMB 11028 / NRRL B-12390 / A12253. 1 / ISP 5477) TaxID=1933 RepID=A0ABT1I4G3_STRSD|nr:hypothetical protein [Streptoalloteichus tenebrarius]MCP2262460.1 hypothetical protein [Streptoalloteichus tenebrarius]BFF01334.1 hypothetical protein GCM10020241_30090 [Streptoalloteichus tenebrarius]
MSGFEIAVPAVSSAGDAAVSAGEQARVVDLASALAGVAEALPGSQATDAARALAEFWRTRIRDWSDAVFTFGRDLREATRLYADNERTAEQDFSSGQGR